MPDVSRTATIKIKADVSDLEAKMQEAYSQLQAKMAAMGMESEKANVKMNASLRTVTDSAGKTTTAFDITGRATQRFGDTVEKTGGGVKVFGMNIVDIAAKLYILQVAARNVAQIMEGAFNLAELGSQVKDTGEDFQRMLDQLGAAPDTFAKMHEAAGGIMTDYQLQTASLKLLIDAQGEYGTAIANSLPRVVEMARVLTNLNPTLGTAQEFLQKFAGGIDSVMIRSLKTSGILVSAADANKKYAESIGKSVTDLTAEDKQIALLNATLEKYDALLLQNGGHLDDAPEKYARLKTSIEESKEALGKFMDEAIGPSIVQLSEQLAQTKKNEAGITSFGETISGAIAVLQRFGYWISVIHIAQSTLDSDVGAGAPVYAQRKQRLEEISAAQTLYSHAIEEGSVAIDTEVRDLAKLNEAQQKIVDGTKLLTDAQKEQLSTLLLTGGSTEQFSNILVDAALSAEKTTEAEKGLNSTEKQLYELMMSLGNTGAAEAIRGWGLAHLDAAEQAKIQLDAEKALKAEFDDFKKGFEHIIPVLKEGDKSYGELQQSVEDAQKALERLGDAGQVYVDGTTRIVKGNKLVAASAEDIAKNQLAVKTATDRLAVSQDNLAAATDKYNKSGGIITPQEQNKINVQINAIAALQLQIESLGGKVTTTTGAWQSNANAIEAAKKKLQEAQGALNEYTIKISEGVFNMAEYVAQQENAFNAENIKILENYAIEMGLIDEKTVAAKDALTLLLDPVNQLSATTKAGGIRAIGEALQNNQDPVTTLNKYLDETNTQLSNIGITTGTGIPAGISLFRTTVDTEGEPIKTKIEEVAEQFQTVDDKIKNIAITDVPAITTATSDLAENTPGYTEKIIGNWFQVYKEFDMVLGKVNAITAAINSMPTSKTVTINVVQTGGIGGQHGLDFIVPSGFPHDTFPMNVSSGERVVVTPAGMESQRNIPRTTTQVVGGSSDNAEIARSLNTLHGVLRQIPTMIGRSMRDNLRQVL